METHIINPFQKECMGKKRPKIDGKCFAIIARVKENKIEFFDKNSYNK